jgi:hypothetical protein
MDVGIVEPFQRTGINSAAQGLNVSSRDDPRGEPPHRDGQAHRGKAEKLHEPPARSTTGLHGCHWRLASAGTGKMPVAPTTRLLKLL